MSAKWIKVENKCVTFLHKDQDEKLHIIRTGFCEDGDQAYMVVHEDVFQMKMGNIEIMSFKRLEEIYGKITGLVG